MEVANCIGLSNQITAIVGEDEFFLCCSEGTCGSFQSKVKMDSEEEVDEGSDNMVMDAMFGESESKNQIGSTYSCTQTITINAYYVFYSF